MTSTEDEFTLGYKEGFNDGYEAGKELQGRKLAEEIAKHLGTVLAPYGITISIDPEW